MLSLMLSSFSVFAYSYKIKLIDSLPELRQSMVVIPFQYQQTALNQSFAVKIIDSVVKVLLQRPGISIAVVGYADANEGNNAICYDLSFKRSLAVKNYLITHATDSSRIIESRGFGSLRLGNVTGSKKNIEYNCRAEIFMYYPLSQAVALIVDKDGDGIPDSEDLCPDEYGSEENKGCPDKNAIIVPFQSNEFGLYSATYEVLDSIINILVKNPLAVLVIAGHAYKTEGGRTARMLLSQDRALIAINYLVSRRIKISRIISVKSFGDLKPLNAGRNPWEIGRNSRVEIQILYE